MRINVHTADPAALDYSVTHEYHRADESYRPRRISDLAGSTTSVLFTDSIRLGRVAFPTADTVFTRATSVRYSDPAVDRAIGVWYELDALDRVVERGTTVAAGDSPRSFDFDRVGRLVLREDTLVTQQEVCEPDPVLGQICSMQPVPGFLDRSAFAYDAVGNRTDSGAQVEEGNRLEAFGGYALEHDLDGNVTRKSLAADSLAFDQRLHWNSLGQLDSVRTVRQGVGSTVAYGYDGWDRRVRKTSAAGTTRYVYDGSQIALEVDGSGNVVAEYSYFPGVDQPHTVKRGGSVYYYLADGPGNVVGLLDAAGNLVNEYHYSPWGEAEVEREGVSQPYRFTGREWDAEVGLYYYRARYYDPQLGRFLSEDPIGLAGGINPYAYAENDPVNNADPSGLNCLRRATQGQCLLWELPGVSNAGSWRSPRPHGWVERLWGSGLGTWGGHKDVILQSIYEQERRAAAEDLRREELIGRAIRSTPSAADVAIQSRTGGGEQSLWDDPLSETAWELTDDLLLCPPSGDGSCIGIPLLVAGQAGRSILLSQTRNLKAALFRSRGQTRIGSDPGAIRWGKGWLKGAGPGGRAERTWRISAGGRKSFLHLEWAWGHSPRILKFGSYKNYAK